MRAVSAEITLSFGRNMSPISSIPARSGSSNKGACRYVVWTCVRPSSFPTIGRYMPPETSSDAKMWRKSWMRRSGISACCVGDNSVVGPDQDNRSAATSGVSVSKPRDVLRKGVCLP